MPYPVYRISDGLVDSFHPTAAAANTRASGVLGLTAYTAADLAVPRLMQPGQAWFNADAATLGFAAPATNLRDAFQASFEAGRAALAIADSIAPGFPAAAHDTFRDYIYYARYYAYLLAKSSAAAHTDARKIAWCSQMARGPSDYRVGQDGVAAAVRKFYAAAQRHTPPEQPSAWVDPVSGDALALANLVTLSGDLPETVSLETGSWIEELG